MQPHAVGQTSAGGNYIRRTGKNTLDEEKHINKKARTPTGCKASKPRGCRRACTAAAGAGSCCRCHRDSDVIIYAARRLPPAYPV